MVGFLGVVSTIASLFVQRKLGELADRWGSRRMQLISGLLIPIVPFAWVFVASPWHVVPINILSGVLWGAYSLASFNYLLELTPADQRARYSALFQLMMTLALAAGAAVGSIIVSSGWAYKGIFIGSAVGRFTAAVLFARFVRAPKGSQDIPESAAS
jgi:MFS family permease